MHDFSVLSARQNSYRNKKGSTSGFIAVVIILLLSFFVILNFAKHFGSGSENKVSWDGVSSYVVSFTNNPNLLFIFQKDPKRSIFVTSGEKLASSNIGNDFLKEASVKLGANVSKFVNVKSSSVVEAKKTYENFTSFITPIKILTVGWGGSGLDTNISRIEALRLWWQLKDIRANDVKTLKIGGNAMDSKSNVLGATSKYLNHEISPYLENLKIVKEDLPIEIINSSGDTRVSTFAENFITSTGGRVVSVQASADVVDSCQIKTNVVASYSVKYLANIFGCVINDNTQEGDNQVVTIQLGKTFAQNYF